MSQFFLLLSKGFGCALILHFFILLLKSFDNVYLLMLLTHTYLFAYIIGRFFNEDKRELICYELFLLPLNVWLIASVVQFFIVRIGGLFESTKLVEYVYNLSMMSGLIFYSIYSIYRLGSLLCCSCCKKKKR